MPFPIDFGMIDKFLFIKNPAVNNRSIEIMVAAPVLVLELLMNVERGRFASIHGSLVKLETL